jgi:hypothetical protein
MKRRTEASFCVSAAMLVLLSALLDPRVSAGLAIFFLLAMSVYLWRQDIPA